MPSTAFYAADFKVFDEPSFKGRIGGIRQRLRPKLEAIGHSLAPGVGRSTGGEVFAHVAKHARRTVNPPAARSITATSSERSFAPARTRARAVVDLPAPFPPNSAMAWPSISTTLP